MAILIIFGAVLPFLLWPIEVFLPYPHVIEEVAKGIFILYLIRSLKRELWIKTTAMTAILFSLSETILYLFNVALTGDISTLFLRFLMTTPLHAGTMLLILFSGMRNKRLIPLGVIASILIHYYFNIFVGKL